MNSAVVVGPRLYLRLLAAEDVPSLYAAELLETETWYAESGRIPISKIAFANMLEGKQSSSPERFRFAICLRESDESIGFTNIREIDWINRNAETGTRINEAKNRGAGYGTEAKHLVLQYAFEVLGMHAMRSDVFEPNTRSVAALIKQGYKPAGKIEAEVCRNGVYYDSLVFDLLRPEWEAAFAEWVAKYG